jgi:hypothetical protein
MLEYTIENGVNNVISITPLIYTKCALLYSFHDQSRVKMYHPACDPVPRSHTPVKPPNKYGETLEYNHLGSVEKVNAKLNDINIKWLSLEWTVIDFVNTPAVLSGYETWTRTSED